MHHSAKPRTRVIKAGAANASRPAQGNRLASGRRPITSGTPSALRTSTTVGRTRPTPSTTANRTRPTSSTTVNPTRHLTKPKPKQTSTKMLVDILCAVNKGGTEAERLAAARNLIGTVITDTRDPNTPTPHGLGPALYAAVSITDAQQYHYVPGAGGKRIDKSVRTYLYNLIFLPGMASVDPLRKSA